MCTLRIISVIGDFTNTHTYIAINNLIIYDVYMQIKKNVLQMLTIQNYRAFLSLVVVEIRKE